MDYESSNYAISAQNLIEALRAMCARADEDGRPYMIDDGASNWDLDCLEDAIHEGSQDCFDRWGDLIEPEEYACVVTSGGSVCRWENGGWSNIPLYRIRYMEDQ